jgi:hypothetical protein
MANPPKSSDSSLTCLCFLLLMHSRWQVPAGSPHLGGACSPFGISSPFHAMMSTPRGGNSPLLNPDLSINVVCMYVCAQKKISCLVLYGKADKFSLCEVLRGCDTATCDAFLTRHKNPSRSGMQSQLAGHYSGCSTIRIPKSMREWSILNEVLN